MCAEIKNRNSTYFFVDLWPFLIFSIGSTNLKRRRYFKETYYKYKPSSDDVQWTKTVTPPTVLRNNAPM